MGNDKCKEKTSGGSAKAVKCITISFVGGRRYHHLRITLVFEYQETKVRTHLSAFQCCRDYELKSMAPTVTTLTMKMLYTDSTIVLLPTLLFYMRDISKTGHHSLHRE